MGVTTESPTEDPASEAPPKRGRGRPPGAYGKYKPRQPKLNGTVELNAAPELIPAKLNGAPANGASVGGGNGPSEHGGPPSPPPFPPSPKRPRGRPSEYTAERAAAICEQLVLGRSLNSILSDDPGMPDRMTVVRWLEANEDFRFNYAKAREIGYDVRAEQVLAKATDADPARVQSVRLEVDTVKWILAKMFPKKYADRIDLKSQAEISGPGGGAVQLDVLLQGALFKPEVLSRLDDGRVEVLRSAIALLAAPAAAGGPGEVIEAEYTVDSAEGAAGG
jgi:hypothetical protein